MTDRYSTIDLSELPPPDVVQPVPAEEIIAARKANIVTRLAALDPDLADDVAAILTLESEPMTKIQETGAYRETIHYARVNDAARAVLLATSTGADLDNLGAFYKVSRADGESDARFRKRISIAPEALTTTGPRGAYEFHVMSVDPSIKSVGLVKPLPGYVNVTFLVSGAGNGVPAPALISAVAAHLLDEKISPMTDIIQVSAPAITSFVVSVAILVPPGPDREMVRVAADAAIKAYVASRHKIDRTVYHSGLVAAAQVPGVERVRIIAPTADVVPAAGGACHATSITVTLDA